MLCLDGAYGLEQGRPLFRRVPPPTPAALDALLEQITARITRHLEHRGLLVRDLESSHLDRAPGEDAAFGDLLVACDASTGRSDALRLRVASDG